ncbi:hypothetical protein [Frankia sp. CIT1]|uniref:hypothetical protein n=1 Tax=Frankia sp. CIT1 TaxID=2880974 RepID=UPI001EF6ADCD|nr:hypothetical protein [Frankia sp. CIT1]
MPRRTGFSSESRSTSAYQPSAPGTDQDTNTSGAFADVNLETRRPRPGPVPPRSGRLCICWPPLIEVGRDLSSMSGGLADSSYRLLLA